MLPHRSAVLKSLCLVLALLAGGPVGHAFAGSSHGASKETHDEGEAGAPAEKAQPNDPTEVLMPPVIVPVTQGSELVGYLYVDVVLKGADAPAAQEIAKSMPLYQDATLRAMNNEPIPVERAETPETKDMILVRLKTALAGLHDAPPVADVVIHDVLSASF